MSARSATTGPGPSPTSHTRVPVRSRYRLEPGRAQSFLQRLGRGDLGPAQFGFGVQLTAEGDEVGLVSAR